MKRFYCRLCKKIIRVRKYPLLMNRRNPELDHPENRIGVCNWHAEWKASNSTQAEGRFHRHNSTVVK